MNPFSEFIKNLTYNGLEYFGLYYSIYPAFVANTEDPENLNRLQLLIPIIDIRVPLRTWAMPKNVFAGPDYGVQCLPQKGDTVWVEFEYGRLKNPIWSHGYYSKGEKPKEFSSSKVYGFKTPGGHYIKIDDETNIIEVQNKEGVKLIIKQDSYFLAKDESKLQPLVLGDELQKQLDIEKARVDGIIDAIKNSKPAVGSADGGLTYQTGMVTLLSLLQSPDYKNIKSEIGKIE
jgi:hypothetical protein